MAFGDKIKLSSELSNRQGVRGRYMYLYLWCTRVVVVFLQIHCYFGSCLSYSVPALIVVDKLFFTDVQCIVHYTNIEYLHVHVHDIVMYTHTHIHTGPILHDWFWCAVPLCLHCLVSWSGPAQWLCGR